MSSLKWAYKPLSTDPSRFVFISKYFQKHETSPHFHFSILLSISLKLIVEATTIGLLIIYIAKELSSFSLNLTSDLNGNNSSEDITITNTITNTITSESSSSWSDLGFSSNNLSEDVCRHLGKLVVRRVVKCHVPAETNYNPEILLLIGHRQLFFGVWYLLPFFFKY